MSLLDMLHGLRRHGQVHPYFRLRDETITLAAGQGSWRIAQLCADYGWPSKLSGNGTIGIVELGGGYTVADVAQFFNTATGASTPLPMPTLTNVSVDSGAANSPGNSADVEVLLDIEVAGAAFTLATGRPANIRMYWANNDIGGIARAVARAAADGCDVCSISWGADEAVFGRTAATQLETAIANAAARGMITFAASGDNDSSDGGSGRTNVDLPAAAPHAVGCGGTNRPHGVSAANPETVWNNNPGNVDGEGTGGGLSGYFTRPTWQVGIPASVPQTGRLVPDLAANADPNTGYVIIYQGQSMVVGGTSAVAPLMAGLFAAFGSKLGFISPKLWANPAAFLDITKGDNGAYTAGTGPDPCTGLGSPHPQALASLLIPKNLTLAGPLPAGYTGSHEWTAGFLQSGQPAKVTFPVRIG